MSYLISAVTELFDWFSYIFPFFSIEVFSHTPLFLFFVLIPLVGLGIGLFKRLLNL